MLKINAFAFYELGKTLAPLVNIQAPTTRGAVVFPLVWARYQIRALLAQEFILVRTSRREAENLIAAISAVVPQEDFTAGIDDVERIVESAEIQNIKDALSQFEAVLSAEMAIAPVFSVPSRGLYNIADLIDNAQLAIPENCVA